jgi:iron complex outermembrane receptor protein
MALALPALCLLCSQAQAAGEAVGTLPTVTVTGTATAINSPPGATALDQAGLTPRLAATSDTASLLADIPGLSLYGAGGVSSLPVIHGLADDRLRIQVDGMDLIASCPNHMNPALSYIDPTQVGDVQVYAGITPVSVGGDSIGGSIAVASRAPEFAAPGQAAITKGEVGGFYRSNNQAQGSHVSASYATDSFNISYSASAAKAENYTAAGDFKTSTASGRAGHTLTLDEVGSSAFETRNQTLALALKRDNHLFEARFGIQDVPYELYPNQRMDLLKNDQRSVNLRYLGQFDWGSLEARAYHETVEHSMDFGADKQFDYGMMGAPSLGMPMITEGKTTGLRVKADVRLTPQDLLRVGAEAQQYRLNDWWPAVAGSMMMGPHAFLNINNGERDRNALFGEWENRLSPNWMTLLGLRLEQVSTKADSVHGYERSSFPTTMPMMDMMNQGRDAALFNNAERHQTDNNIDLTALAKYTANVNYDIEFGLAHKVRSPNLYERYSWSTADMMAIMNNVVGDGNGYLGDVKLKPEKANTLSATFDWHAADSTWGIKATPFYTQVADYIDALQWNASSNTAATSLTSSQFSVLKYVNQSARLYGLNLSGHLPLGATAWGEFGLKGLLNYTRGTNQDTGDGLYNIMPLNAKLAVTQHFGAWDNSLELVTVKAKTDVSSMRNEIKTPGYSLVNLRASHSWKTARLDVGVENLFDKFYYLPTGGAYTGQGATMGITSIPYGVAVPGMGRSIYVGVNVKF